MKKMIRSSLGDSPKTTYLYADLIKNKLNKDIYDVLVLDTFDGYTLMPFAIIGLNVDGYEMNEEYIEILKQRLENENLADKVNIYNTNFYKSNNKKKYDFVYVYQSLDKECYSDISMNKKVHAILDSVKLGGYIYIYYLMAIDENDYINYPSNQYLRSYEMSNMFDSNWQIIYCKERNKLRDNNRIGYIFVYKKPKKVIKHRYHYKIKTGQV